MKPPSKNAILLSDVQSLTLRGSGALTTHRRVPAAPQLKCISHPDVCALHALETMRCVNQGSGYDSEDIQWSCTASLPAELKLGSTDVICEGYSRADDPYVLKGSCGVEYRLALTDKGEERYPDIGRGSGGSGSGGRQGDGASDPSAWLFGILFVAVAGWIIYSACTAPQRNRGHRIAAAGGRRGGGGGGGGGGGWGPGGGGGGSDTWDDPPPPYPGNSKTSRSGQQQQGGGAGGGWRPGFWSGILGGAAAGYAAGNRGSRNNNSINNNGGWGGNNRNYGTNNGSGGGGWGGSSTSSSRSNSGSSWGTASGPRHESTGFGGTSRR